MPHRRSTHRARLVSASSTHIGDVMTHAGDVIVSIPDGSTLDGANVSLAASSHAATAGAYKGWLIIACQTKGGSTLDLSDPLSGSYRGGLNLVYDGVGHSFQRLPLRIMFAGFKVKWGTVGPNWINRLRFWHCDFTWPDTVWQTYYDSLYFAAHGTHTSPSPSTALDASVFPASNMYHPTMVGIDQCSKNAGDSAAVKGLEFFFCDFHNIGDDAIYVTSSDITVRGCRFDDIYHHGTNYFNPATGGDLIHSDVIQAAGSNLLLRNVSLGGHIDWEGTGAGSVGVDGDTGWLYGSSIPAAGFGTDGSHNIVGTMNNFKWFGCGQYYHSGLNPATQSTPYYDASQDRLLDAYDPPGLTWDGSSATAWAAGHKVLPSGMSVVSGSGTPGQNGLLTDLATPLAGSYPNVPSAFNHASNPAVIDQTANPYSSWSTFFTSYGWS